jgi:hypothetical protein
VGSSTGQGRTWTATVTSTATDFVGGTWSTPTGDVLATCENESTCALAGLRKSVPYVTFSATTSGEAIDVLKP